jgi:hypothetical protein
MPVNMIGYKVAHDNCVYKCLQVEPLWGPNGIHDGEMDRPEHLRVAIIDHDGYFAVIDDFANQFVFMKDNGVK